MTYYPFGPKSHPVAVMGVLALIAICVFGAGGMIAAVEESRTHSSKALEQN
ncbi:hypothetical protein H7X87_02050 [Acetobacteraceae bacterium]|nr:hypothetical protein [Candidatus Parcubacteria bacterium]